MLRSVKNLHSAQVTGNDGTIGTVERYMFDDVSWLIRYFIVNGKGDFEGKSIVVPSELFIRYRWEDESLDIHLHNSSIEESPEIEKRLPDTKLDEDVLIREFGWAGKRDIREKEKRIGVIQTYGKHKKEGPVKRSVNQIDKGLWGSRGGMLSSSKGPSRNGGLINSQKLLECSVYSRDQELGPVDDVAVDDSNWKIQYIIVLPYEKVSHQRILVYTDWVEEVVLEKNSVSLDRPTEFVVSSAIL